VILAVKHQAINFSSNIRMNEKITKFLLIGLPATGKTTILTECVNFLQKRDIDCNLISTDNLINQRIKPEDSVIQQYEKDHGLKVSSDIFTETDPSRAFIKIYGETAFRDLEERFLIDIIESSHENDWFDFGARALTLPGVVKAVEAKKTVPIFLYAEHETIIARLEKDEGWKQRPTYMNAAEKSSDGQGWKTNAEMHRKDRLAKYIELSAITISVEKNASELLGSNQAGEQSAALYKSPEEIVQEIFARLKELELVTSNNHNQFSNHCTNFFAGKPPEELAGHQQFEETKEWLENNLKLQGMKVQKS
jgi:shikimate kinase